MLLAFVAVVLCTSISVGPAHAAMDMPAMEQMTAMTVQSSADAKADSDELASVACDGVCLAGIADGCAPAGLMAASSLLMLLMLRRPTNALALTGRSALSLLLRHRDEFWRRTTPSLTDLCILRV